MRQLSHAQVRRNRGSEIVENRGNSENASVEKERRERLPIADIEVTQGPLLAPVGHAESAVWASPGSQ